MDALGRRAIAGALQLLAVLAACLFLPARTLAYSQAWAYLAVFACAVGLITAYLLKYDRALLERRMSAGPTSEKRPNQRVIQVAASLAFLSMYLWAAVDRHFGWTHVPVLLEAAGDVLAALGFWIVFLAFKANTFTAGTIDVWENQTVVASGPYAVVRHPMYAGGLLLLFATPLALGSWWAFVPLLPMTVALVLRLVDEEHFLVRSLPGYEEYRKSVRVRLLPGVW